MDLELSSVQFIYSFIFYSCFSPAQGHFGLLESVPTVISLSNNNTEAYDHIANSGQGEFIRCMMHVFGLWLEAGGKIIQTPHRKGHGEETLLTTNPS